MTFIQVEFLWLMAIVFAVYWLLPRRAWQNALLVLVSAVFYGWIHPWFLILLYGSSLIDYGVGLAMERWPAKKKLFLVLSLCSNLGMLAWFKYVDFFIENVLVVFQAMGLKTSMHTLGVLLPVGISFYTFQTMSYSIDVCRGQLKARRNLLDYMTFVSFFPQLVAGPIERAGNLLRQVEQERRFRWTALRSGVALALWGAFKKVVCADSIAPHVDKVFILKDPAGPLIWAATLGFSIQILADFSGYTDIARGVSRMLGFELVENFKHPYLAANPSEFWRRWHISFSSWIRDYLYIPMGGSRGGLQATTRRTFIVMTLSGLWHGAAWTFVLWGVFHAALLTGYRLVTPRIPESWRQARLGPVPVGRSAAVVIMFGLTLVGWMIFRETHIDRLLGYWSQNPLAASPDEWVATWIMLGVCAFTAAPLVGALLWERLVLPRLKGSAWHLPVQTSGWALIALAIFVFHRDVGDDFIYFQF